MKFMKNTIKSKIIVSTIVLLGLMFIMAIFLMSSTRKHSLALNDSLLKMSEIKTIIDSSEDMKSYVSDYLITKNSNLLIVYDEVYKQTRNDINLYMEEVPDPLSLQFYYLKNIWEAYDEKMKKIIRALNSYASSTDIQILFKEASIHENFVRDQIAIILSELIEIEEKNSVEVSKRIVRWQYILTFFAVAFTFGLVIISNIFSKRLTKPITDLTDYVDEIGDGKFDSKFPYDSINVDSEIYRIAKSVDHMKEQLSLAFSKIQEHNDSLDKLILKRTKELEDTNEELKASLDTLTQLQEQLISSEKQLAMQQLIRHLAHNLNTPLGTSITTSSYLSNKLRHYKKNGGLIKFDDFDEAIDLILNSQMTLKNFIEKMKELLVSYDTSATLVNIKELIETIKTEIAFQNDKISFEVMYEGDFKKMYLLPLEGVNGLFRNLFSLSAKITSKDAKVDVHILEDSQNIKLLYFDKNLMKHDELDLVLNGGNDMEFQMSVLGLDTYVIKDIVLRVCSGDIVSIKEDDHIKGFKIEIPKVKVPYEK